VKVYVASSWRNGIVGAVVSALRVDGHRVYDFRENGFRWSEIDEGWKSWSPEEYIRAMDHPLAVRGFERDMRALGECDAVVLVQPCGASAHLELGWAVDHDKRTLVLLNGQEPELMYGMVDSICPTMNDVQEVLRDAAR
jgi:hypothetical protein